MIPQKLPEDQSVITIFMASKNVIEACFYWHLSRRGESLRDHQILKTDGKIRFC
jgi:hypothetical protein